MYPPPPSPPSLWEHRHAGPDPHHSPTWGIPGPVLPANFPAASRGPSRVRVPPRAPSHLPYHSIPPPSLHSRGPVSRAERRRKQGAGRAALALVTVVLRYGRSANPGDRAGRGRAPLAAPRPLAPSIAWRRAGKLASWQAGSAPQEGKEREGQLTLPPPSPLSQREARSPRRSRADQSLEPHGECGLRPANLDREPTTPSMQCAGDTSGQWGARARRALARRRGRRGLWCVLGWRFVGISPGCRVTCCFCARTETQGWVCLARSIKALVGSRQVRVWSPGEPHHVVQTTCESVV